MLKPVHGNVVIEPVEVEKKTSSGIILTGSREEAKYGEGVVLAVGPGHWKTYAEGREEMSVKVGDRVLYHLYTEGQKIPCDGKEVSIIDEGQIMAIVEEAKA